MSHSFLPNFFVVGAQKAGTTSLYHYLNAHPDIYLPSKKETRFFVMDELYSKGIDFYKTEFFSSVTTEKVIGEMDPNYIYFDFALNRILRHIKNPKFIFIFRNPIDRAFSHYLMNYRRGKEPLNFSDAIKIEPSRITNGFIEKRDYSYISRGLYAQQLEYFMKTIDNADMLFILSEDLRHSTESIIKQCLEFLDVESEWLPGNIGNEFHKASIPKSVSLYKAVRYQSPLRNIARLLVPGKKMRKSIRDAIYAWNTTNEIKMTMTEETRRYLLDLYHDENIRLGELIGRDLSHWNQ